MNNKETNTINKSAWLSTPITDEVTFPFYPHSRYKFKYSSPRIFITSQLFEEALRNSPFLRRSNNYIDNFHYSLTETEIFVKPYSGG